MNIKVFNISYSRLKKMTCSKQTQVFNIQLFHPNKDVCLTKNKFTLILKTNLWHLTLNILSANIISVTIYFKYCYGVMQVRVI